MLKKWSENDRMVIAMMCFGIFEAIRTIVTWQFASTGKPTWNFILLATYWFA